MVEKQRHVAIVSMYDAASAVTPLCTCAEQMPAVCAACIAYFSLLWLRCYCVPVSAKQVMSACAACNGRISCFQAECASSS